MTSRVSVTEEGDLPGGHNRPRVYRASGVTGNYKEEQLGFATVGQVLPTASALP
jgi:hypothetical protein